MFVQTQKNTLLLNSAENKRRLKENEDEILIQISSSKGSLLDNESALRILSDTKSAVVDLQARLSLSACCSTLIRMF